MHQSKCNHLRTDGAPSGGRTHTWRILSPLPLPLGYRGARSSERAESTSESSRVRNEHLEPKLSDLAAFSQS